jgi:hypothetical protein
MAQAATETTGTTAGGRGTGYPAFSLEEALVRARKFWEAERKNAAPVSAAVKHWGYGDKSSGGKRTISALIQYGLLSDAGTDAKRTVKLTDRALTILLQEQNSDMWLRAVREAAESPKIYADLLTKWPAHELPSDASLQFYLVKDRNFNPSTVVDFLKDFRATVAFARLDEVPGSTRQESSLDGEPLRAEPVDLANAQPAAIAAAMANTARALPAPAPGVKQDVFSLDEGQVVLQWPAKMSATSFQDFKDWIDLQIRKIGRTVE